MKITAKPQAVLRTAGNLTRARSAKVPLVIIAFTAIIALSMTGCPDEPKPGPSNQTPIAADYDIDNLSQEAGSVTAVTVTAKADKSPGAVSNIQYDGSTDIPQTEGSYPVTFDVAAATGWNAATGLSAGTLTVTSGGVNLSGNITVSPSSGVTTGT